MKVIAVNGSPRKSWNTATLLHQALAGAVSCHAETEIVHLYDLDYKGCRSCFSCKLENGPSYGRCAVQDDLTPIFAQIEAADALLLGSPIYVGSISGAMKSFFERLTFQYLVYDGQMSSLFPRRIRTGLVCAMGANEARAQEMGFDQPARMHERVLARIFGAAESLLVFDTLQFDDYSRYVCPGHDPAAKARRRAEVFPEDCRKAFELGMRLAGG